jgi:hypothetical protein
MIVHSLRVNSLTARRIAVITEFLLGILGMCWVPGQQHARAAQAPSPDAADRVQRLFGSDNLVAWCIVPFDSKKRGPEERAAMLERLGFKHFAYDWRAEHVPTFDAEMDALKRHGIALDAFWAPGELNNDSKIILEARDQGRSLGCARHGR